MPQVPIRWTPANTPYDEVVHYSSLLTELAHLGAKSVQELDPMNDWVFLRVRSQKHEIMVCPEKDFMMIVVQVSHLTSPPLCSPPTSVISASCNCIEAPFMAVDGSVLCSSCWVVAML